MKGPRPSREAGWLQLLVVTFAFVHLAPAELSGQTGGEPFADCEARLAAGPESWASLCFVSRAREHRLWSEGQRRVKAHLATRPADPYLLYTLGLLEIESGSLPEAAELFRAAAEGFAARGHAEGEALAWNNVNESLVRQGLLEEAGRAVQRAEEAARAAADPGLLVMVGVRQTRLIRRQGGDLERADRLLRAMEEELPADAGYGAWKSLLYERATVLLRLGRPDEARGINERWAELARGADKPYDEATALASIAVNVAGKPPRAGAREEATRLARGALESAERAGNRSALVTAHLLLGKLLPGDEGRAHLEECLRRTTSAGETLQQASCLFALAGSLAAEDPERARVTLDEAHGLAAASEDPWTAAYGWSERFRVSWAARSRRDAAADSLAAVDHIEALRRLQSSETGRAGFFADWAEVYHSLAGFLLKAPDGPSRDELETAFAVAERLRARVLLDSLAAAKVEAPAPADDGLAEERTAVLKGIVRIQRALMNPALGEAERRDFLVELDVLERDLAELEGRLAAGPATAFPELGFVALSRVEADLAPNQALLAFLVAPDEDVFGKFAGGSWLMAVTNGGARAYRLPGRTQLEIKVQMFLGLVETRDDGLLELGSAALYDDLLSAALAEVPARVEELILVPDGVLHLLPFGLLRSHVRAEPLAASYRIFSVPSATLWHLWRLEPEAPPAVLVLADPAFPGGAGAPESGEADDATSEDREWALAAGARLGRLPHAAGEGRSLLRRLGGPPSRLLLGEEASEAFLKGARLDDVGAVHLAAHALVDVERPGRSAVLLAAGGGGEDGLLQPREIAALDLAGKLVVLSTCKSGSGQVLVGEGVQSLARAFFRAGARAVVASLWRLRDDEAADFFDLFYRALADGESVAGAVAAARVELRAAGAPAAAWAGVVVLGDGGMVPLAGGLPRSRWRIPPVALLALAAASLAVALLAWAAHSRRRRNP